MLRYISDVPQHARVCLYVCMKLRGLRQLEVNEPLEPTGRQARHVSAMLMTSVVFITAFQNAGITVFEHALKLI